MEVRAAAEGELAAAMTAFDAGGLAVDAGDARRAIRAGGLLVAVQEGRVLGTLLLEPRAAGAEIDAVAVLPGRRGQGIGTALVRAAAERHGRLVAAFDPRVRPFWAALGFEIGPAEEPGRLVGVLEAAGGSE